MCLQPVYEYFFFFLFYLDSNHISFLSEPDRYASTTITENRIINVKYCISFGNSFEFIHSCSNQVRDMLKYVQFSIYQKKNKYYLNTFINRLKSHIQCISHMCLDFVS